MGQGNNFIIKIIEGIRVNFTCSQQTWKKKYLDKTCYMIAHLSVPYERSHQELSADLRVLFIG